MISRNQDVESAEDQDCVSMTRRSGTAESAEDQHTVSMIRTSGTAEFALGKRLLRKLLSR